MNLTNYSTHVKRTALEKILGAAGMSVSEVSEEMGINKNTLYGWVQKSHNGSMSNRNRRSGRRKVDFQKKYQTILEAKELSEEDLGKWLREKGYREEQLKLWQKEIEIALNQVDAGPSRDTEKELRELKKELNRKDRALAEVSALLVLKKKFNALMGMEEDSEQ